MVLKHIFYIDRPLFTVWDKQTIDHPEAKLSATTVIVLY